MSDLIVTTDCASGRHFEWELYRHIDAGIGLDAYRMGRVWEQDPSGARMHGGDPVVIAGNWETVLFEDGLGDYVGGLHGYETLAEVFGEQKGHRVDLGVGASFDPRLFRVVQRSIVCRRATAIPIVEKLVQWSFRADTLTIRQNLRFLADVTLTYAYLAMLPVVRKIGVEQITDIGRRSPSYVDEDIGEAGFGLVFSDADIIQVCGTVSGLRTQVEIKEWPATVGKVNFISNAVQYNKIYLGDNTTGAVSTGDEWNVEVEYRITSEA